MYAFTADTDEQRALLREKGAIWSPSLERWIIRDPSSWALRKFKRKGLVPQVPAAPIQTTNPAIKWPLWIKIIAYGPATFTAFIALIFLIQAGMKELIGSLIVIIAVGIPCLVVWIGFSTILSKLAYSIYRRLRGDRRYWEALKTEYPQSRNSRDDLPQGITETNRDDVTTGIVLGIGPYWHLGPHNRNY